MKAPNRLLVGFLLVLVLDPVIAEPKRAILENLNTNEHPGIDAVVQSLTNGAKLSKSETARILQIEDVFNRLGLDNKIVELWRTNGVPEQVMRLTSHVSREAGANQKINDILSKLPAASKQDIKNTEDLIHFLPWSNMIQTTSMASNDDSLPWAVKINGPNVDPKTSDGLVYDSSWLMNNGACIKMNTASETFAAKVECKDTNLGPQIVETVYSGTNCSGTPTQQGTFQTPYTDPVTGHTFSCQKLHKESSDIMRMKHYSAPNCTGEYTELEVILPSKICQPLTVETGTANAFMTAFLGPSSAVMDCSNKRAFYHFYGGDSTCDNSNASVTFDMTSVMDGTCKTTGQHSAEYTCTDEDATADVVVFEDATPATPTPTPSPTPSEANESENLVLSSHLETSSTVVAQKQSIKFQSRSFWFFDGTLVDDACISIGFEHSSMRLDCSDDLASMKLYKYNNTDCSGSVEPESVSSPYIMAANGWNLTCVNASKDEQDVVDLTTWNQDNCTGGSLSFSMLMPSRQCKAYPADPSATPGQSGMLQSAMHGHFDWLVFYFFGMTPDFAYPTSTYMDCSQNKLYWSLHDTEDCSTNDVGIDMGLSAAGECHFGRMQLVCHDYDMGAKSNEEVHRAVPPGGDGAAPPAVPNPYPEDNSNTKLIIALVILGFIALGIWGFQQQSAPTDSEKQVEEDKKLAEKTTKEVKEDKKTDVDTKTTETKSEPKGEVVQSASSTTGSKHSKSHGKKDELSE